MKKYKIAILFFFGLFFTGNFVFPADNLMGGDITWTCVGKDSFLIKLRLIGDCNSSGLENQSLKLYCATTNQLITTIILDKSFVYDITNVCPGYCTRCSDSSCNFPYGFREYHFDKLVVINVASCCEISIRYQECCRSDEPTNISSGQPFFLESVMNRCLSPCDNSPVFYGRLVYIECIGRDVVIDQGIVEIDIDTLGHLLDSVVYEWTTPKSDYNTKIPFLYGYDSSRAIYFWGYPDEWLPAPYGLKLDDVGNIVFRPEKAESAVMVVKVKTFRKGVKTCEINRNYLFIILKCPVNRPPSLGPAIYYKEVCAGSNVAFTIHTNDTDPNDTLTISWNHGIAGAYWKDNNGLAKHPTGIFSWTPGENQASALPYSFTVTVRDPCCTHGPIDIHGTSFTKTYQVLVLSKPRAAITIADSGYGEYRFSARCLQGKDPAFHWSSDSFFFQSPDSSTASHHFNKAGRYPYRMKITTYGGCSRTYYDTLDAKINTSLGNIPELNVLVYPNPATKSLTVESTRPDNKISSIAMYDQSGRLVYSATRINRPVCSFPVNVFKPGIYSVKVLLKNHTLITKKVMIQ